MLFCLFLLVGHTHIDILKIDLEGWEFDALTAFLIPSSEFSSERPRIPPVSQMLLELHVWNREFPELLRWWNTLERAGFRAVTREPNLVYQNYNRMQGAELAEVRLCNFSTFPNALLTDVIVHLFERCRAKRFYIRCYSDNTAGFRPLSVIIKILRDHHSHPFLKTTSTPAKHQGFTHVGRDHDFDMITCISEGRLFGSRY